ncbi:MAG: branched-chain amino acid ABC transporter permease [Peptococcia bacterium]
MLVSAIINGLIIGSSYVLVASGLTLIFGILDVVNLAHGEIYMLGAFVAFTVATLMGINFWIALLIAMIVVGCIGILLEKLFFKQLREKPHIYMMIVSMALSTLLSNLAMLIWGSEPRMLVTPMANTTIRFLGTAVTLQRLIVIVVGAVLIVLLNLFIEKTTTGKTLRATAQDRDASALMGININKVFSITFALGCALAAAAGTLIAPVFQVFPTMGLNLFSKSFTVVIMGGLGNILGAVFAGLLLGIVESLGAVFISTAYKDAFSFIILILFLLFRPNGIMGRG